MPTKSGYLNWERELSGLLHDLCARGPTTKLRSLHRWAGVLIVWGHSMTNEGTVMQDGDESPVQPEPGGFSSGPSAKSASVRSEPGILIFSRRPQLLHMNPRASELTGRFDRAETRSATLALSRLVSELRVQIQDNLDGRIEANVWEPFELRRLMFEFGRKRLFFVDSGCPIGIRSTTPE